MEAQRDGVTCLYSPSSQLFDRSVHLLFLQICLCESTDFTEREGGHCFWREHCYIISTAYSISPPLHYYFHPIFFFFCQTHVSTSKIQGHLNKNDGLDVLTKLTRATKPTTKKKHFFTLNTETSFLSLRHTCNSNVCISSEREMNGENCFTGPWFAYICVTVWMGVVLLLNIRQSTITDNWDFTGMFKKWSVNTNSPS